jgi:hypothetical protein
MQDFLNNQGALSLIGLIATLLIGLLTILVPYLYSRKRNVLWYWASVFPVVEEVWQEAIEILVNNKAEPTVYMCTISMRYQGDPITKDAYDVNDKVTFDFQNEVVLAVEAYETSPEDRRATVEKEGDHKAVLEPRP